MSPTSFIDIRKTLFCVARSIARHREPAKEGGDSKACSAEVSAYDSRWMTASFSSCSELSSSFNSELSSSNSEARKTRGKKRFLIALYPRVGRYVRPQVKQIVERPFSFASTLNFEIIFSIFFMFKQE